MLSGVHTKRGFPMRVIQHFIGGISTTAAPARLGDVFDPSVGMVQAQVALGDAALLNEAVASAKAAQPAAAQRRSRPDP